MVSGFFYVPGWKEDSGAEGAGVGWRRMALRGSCPWSPPAGTASRGEVEVDIHLYSRGADMSAGLERNKLLNYGNNLDMSCKAVC